MNIIANLFRDIGQPDTGLTAAVEEVAGATMRRKARAEGNSPTRFDPRLFNENNYHKEITAKRAERMHRIMCIVREKPTTRIDLVASLGISDGQHFVDLFANLEDRGLLTMTRARPRSYFTITEAGRAWLAEKVAAE